MPLASIDVSAAREAQAGAGLGIALDRFGHAEQGAGVEQVDRRREGRHRIAAPGFGREAPVALGACRHVLAPQLGGLFDVVPLQFLEPGGGEGKTGHFPGHVRLGGLAERLEGLQRLLPTLRQRLLKGRESGIGRGLFDMGTLNAIHEKMHRALAHVGGRVDAIFYCPHTADSTCDCRKPRPGLLREAGRRFSVDMTGVPVIGDGLRDLQAAEAVGGQPMLVLTGKGEKTLREGGFPKNTAIFPDLAFAVSALLADR